MNNKLQQKFDALEKSKSALLGKLHSIKTDELNRKQSVEKWSALQVVYHQVQVEKGVILYMTKKLSDKNSLKKTEFKNAWNSFLVNVALKLPLKFKAPPVLDAMPESIDWFDLQAEWKNNRLQLEQLLQDMPNEVMDKKIFRHPISGYMNVFHTLDFVQAHFNHHIPQINRCLSV